MQARSPRRPGRDRMRIRPAGIALWTCTNTDGTLQVTCQMLLFYIYKKNQAALGKSLCVNVLPPPQPPRAMPPPPPHRAWRAQLFDVTHPLCSPRTSPHPAPRCATCAIIMLVPTHRARAQVHNVARSDSRLRPRRFRRPRRQSGRTIRLFRLRRLGERHGDGAQVCRVRQGRGRAHHGDRES